MLTYLPAHITMETSISVNALCMHNKITEFDVYITWASEACDMHVPSLVPRPRLSCNRKRRAGLGTRLARAKTFSFDVRYLE